MKIQVYGKQNCTFCVKTKTWLDEKNISYTYIDVLKDISISQLIEIKELYNMNTVPIIVINNKLIGGYMDLIKLNLPAQ